MERRDFLKYVAGAIAGASFCETAEASTNSLARLVPLMLQYETSVIDDVAFRHLKEGMDLKKLEIPQDSRLHLALKSSVESVYTSSGTEMTPEFVYAGALSEGLDAFLDKYPNLNPKRVDGFDYLGLQRFGENVKELRLKGYLPEDFQEGRRFEIVNRINEKDEPVRSGRFKSFEDAILAMTAEYAWRRDALKADLPELGIPEERMTNKDMDFWNYAYYIGGNGCGKSMLGNYAKRGILDKGNYIWSLPKSGFSQVHYLARERMASLQVIYSRNGPNTVKENRL